MLQLIMMECVHYSSIQVSSGLSERDRLFNVVLFTDGSRLCTCGGDGIVRVLDPTSKLEIISKRAPETLQ